MGNSLGNGITIQKLFLWSLPYFTTVNIQSRRNFEEITK